MRRFNGFSLMEMMIVLLIVAIIAAASAPMVSKKITKEATEEGCLWSSVVGGKSIYFNKENSSVIIGDKETKSFGKDNSNADKMPALYINDKDYKEKAPQISIVSKYSDNPLHFFNKKNSIALTSIVPGIKCEETSGQKLPLKVVDVNAIQEDTITVGIGSVVGAKGGVTLGTQSSTGESSAYAVALGAGATVESTSPGAVAIGKESIVEAGAEGAVAIGPKAAIGSNALNSVAIGTSAILDNVKYAIAMSGEVSIPGSVVIGNSATDRSPQARPNARPGSGYGSDSGLGTDLGTGSNGPEYFEPSITIPDIGGGAPTPPPYTPTFDEEVENKVDKIIEDSVYKIGVDSGFGAGSTIVGTAATSFGAEGASVFGYKALANWPGSIAVGTNSKSIGSASIAVGTESKALKHSVSVGVGAYSDNNSVAIGALSSANNNGIALGVGASTDEFQNSVAIGCGAQASANNQIVLGTENSTVYIPGNLVVDNAVVLARNNGARVYARIPQTDGDNPFMMQVARTDGADGSGEDDMKVDLGKRYDSVTMDSDYPLGIKLPSDRRLKNVGKAFVGGLEELKKLDLFHYTYKKDPTKTPHVGVMAQDLQKVFPDAVMKGDDGFLRIRMEDMFYALVNAVKELDAKVDEAVLKIKSNFDEIVSIKKRLDAQEKRIQELEKRLEKLEKNK